jgi:hypothetical protein
MAAEAWSRWTAAPRFIGCSAIVNPTETGKPAGHPGASAKAEHVPIYPPTGMRSIATHESHLLPPDRETLWVSAKLRACTKIAAALEVASGSATVAGKCEVPERDHVLDRAGQQIRFIRPEPPMSNYYGAARRHILQNKRQ